jgi:hypothetical protein
MPTNIRASDLNPNARGWRLLWQTITGYRHSGKRIPLGIELRQHVYLDKIYVTKLWMSIVKEQAKNEQGCDQTIDIDRSKSNKGSRGNLPPPFTIEYGLSTTLLCACGSPLHLATPVFQQPAPSSNSIPLCR